MNRILRHPWITASTAAVSAAVLSALATAAINPDSLGLSGSSPVSITETDLFCAVAGRRYVEAAEDQRAERSEIVSKMKLAGCAYAPAIDHATSAQQQMPTVINPAPGISGTPSVSSAYLYIEQVQGVQPTVEFAKATWTRNIENRTVDLEVAFQDPRIVARISFQPNDDPSLPASYLLAIRFEQPAGAPIVTNVVVPKLKMTEQQRGESLVAVAVQIDPSFFMVALNDTPDAKVTNRRLIAGSPWIDLPVELASGKRSLITVERTPSVIAWFKELTDV
ncbi:hypothetical protein [Rhizobium sp. Rhizsp42]|uniref:hypothetical protein n=1 Tax=Rhizobium sp. Rhizsp42 TaxID=3243034 RepID=UPI0039B04F78